MRLVHGRRRVWQELPVETHDEAGVTFQQEVDRELLQQVGDVVVGGNVVDKSLDLDKNWVLELLNFVDIFVNWSNGSNYI